TAGDETQFLRKDFRPKPRFAKVQFVLPDQTRRKPVEEREAPSLQIWWRTAKAYNVREKHSVLGDVRCEKQIGRRKLIGVAIRVCFLSFNLEDTLWGDGRIDADRHAVL